MENHQMGFHGDWRITMLIPCHFSEIFRADKESGRFSVDTLNRLLVIYFYGLGIKRRSAWDSIESRENLRFISQGEHYRNTCMIYGKFECLALVKADKTIQSQ